jgi:hypothetical protein
VATESKVADTEGSTATVATMVVATVVVVTVVVIKGPCSGLHASEE